MNIIVKMHDRVRVIETTRMDLHSGIMLEDDFLDISDYLNQGVLLERSVFITTSDDMQLLKRAVTIIEPDELEAVEGVYADGKPILVRTEDGSRLAPAVFEVLFDDSGNYLGDHGQGLCIYYESGSYETIVPTVLSFGDGMLMADDLIDWSDLDSGITWTRGAWTRGDRNFMELRPAHGRGRPGAVRAHGAHDLRRAARRHEDRRGHGERRWHRLRRFAHRRRGDRK